MNSSSFLRADGTIDRPRAPWWSDWLPSLRHVQQAIRLPYGAEPSRDNAVWMVSMRQGLGLVVIAALLAGFLPFLFNTITAMRMGTVLPLAQLAQQSQELSDGEGTLSQLGETWQTLAGLPPAFLPGWLAALLSTLGEWINWPLRWLTWWLVYGTVVLLAAKVLGAPTTLQRFLGATGYAAVPMILTALGPIPCLGLIAQLLAVVWMLAVYTAAVRGVTGLDWVRAAVTVILPGAAAILLGILALLATASTLLKLIF